MTAEDLKTALEERRLKIAEMTEQIPAQIEASDFIDEALTAVESGNSQALKSLVWELFSQNADDLADEFEQVGKLAERQALANVAAVQ